MCFLVGVPVFKPDGTTGDILDVFWVPCYKKGSNIFQEGELTHLIRRFENLFYKKETGDVEVR